MNKAEKLAEEYFRKVMIHMSEDEKKYYLENPNSSCTLSAFVDGWDARDQDLRESSEEFDPEEIRDLARTYLSTHKATLGNIDAALYQFKKDQLKYQSLFSAYSKLDNINIELNHRIADLKAEIENSNKFAQDQENQINTLAFEKTKETQEYVLRIQELEDENARMKEGK